MDTDQFSESVVTRICDELGLDVFGPLNIRAFLEMSLDSKAIFVGLERKEVTRRYGGNQARLKEDVLNRSWYSGSFALNHHVGGTPLLGFNPPPVCDFKPFYAQVGIAFYDDLRHNTDIGIPGWGELCEYPREIPRVPKEKVQILQAHASGADFQIARKEAHSKLFELAVSALPSKYEP